MKQMNKAKHGLEKVVGSSWDANKMKSVSDRPIAVLSMSMYITDFGWKAAKAVYGSELRD